MITKKEKRIPADKDPFSLLNPKYVKKLFKGYNEGYRLARIKADQVWKQSYDWPTDYTDTPEETEKSFEYLYDLTRNMVTDNSWVFEFLKVLFLENIERRKEVKRLVSAMRQSDLARREKILNTIGIEYQDVEFLKFFRKQVEDRI